MAITIDLDVSYAQLAVFVSSLKQPFNDWTEKHVSQGFSWRPGSVSFRTIAEAGLHSVVISVLDHIGPVHDDAIRVVDVPFDVSPDGLVEIASIADAAPISLPPGTYLLRCEFLSSLEPTRERVQLTFARKETPRFEVARVDAQLKLDGELLTTAEPALC